MFQKSRRRSALSCNCFPPNRWEMSLSFAVDPQKFVERSTFLIGQLHRGEVVFSEHPNYCFFLWCCQGKGMEGQRSCFSYIPKVIVISYEKVYRYCSLGSLDIRVSRRACKQITKQISHPPFLYIKLRVRFLEVC